MGSERHIVAWGGTKSGEPKDNAPMLSYMLKLARQERPRVLIMGPGADETLQGYHYFTLFAQFDCRVTHLSLFKAPTADLEGFVMERDLVYVGGGNTKCMMALWREFGMDRILKKAWKEGVVLSGVSAGAICWFEQCLSDSIPSEMTPLKTVGILEGSAVPHYDSRPDAPAALQQYVKSGELKAGYAIEDEVALHFTGTELAEVVTLKKGQAAYRFGLSEGTVRMERLEPVMLGL